MNLTDFLWQFLWQFVYALILLSFFFVADVLRLTASIGAKTIWIVLIVGLPVIGIGLYFFYGRKRYFHLSIPAVQVSFVPETPATDTITPGRIGVIPLVCAILTVPAAFAMGPLFIDTVPLEVSIWFVLPLPLAGYTYAAITKDKDGKIANISVMFVVALIGIFYYLWRGFTF